MAIHEHDSDLIQWGLRLLDGDPDPGFNSGYYNEMMQSHSGDFYNERYSRDHYETYFNNVENDEIIARTLQEEFSQLAVAEASEYSPPEEEHYQVSTPVYTWQSPLARNLDGDCGQTEAGVALTSSSCASPGNQEEYLHPERTDEYENDDELCWQLNEINPIPHVPRINGEIPSVDEETSDYQRLLDRLQLYEFVEHKVPGDGNCQFRALSDQLYHTPDHHKRVRHEIANQLKSHPEIYEGYVPMAYNDYLEKMSTIGEWGDHVTLQAAADTYGVKIYVITSFKDAYCIEILPHFNVHKYAIYLSFWAEVHYNSIYPQGDIPSSEHKKKKKWWSFGNKN